MSYPERLPGDAMLPGGISEATIARHQGDGDTIQCACERWLDADVPEWQWRMEVCGREECIDRRLTQLLEAERKYDAMQHDLKRTLEKNGRIAA